MPPRGLRLFVRPIEAADHPLLDDFLARQKEFGSSGLLGVPRSSSDGCPPEEPTHSVPAWGLLGKLLGDIVAVVALQITEDALRVEDVMVARDLRRKWIGRVMMREVEDLAVRMDRRRIVVEHAGDAQEFFRRVGFHSEGERWVRVVP